MMTRHSARTLARARVRALTRTAGVALAFLIVAPAAGDLTGARLAAQQVPDTLFRPAVARPAWAEGNGPRLCLDEAHHNFHTLDNRFFAFGALARRDGYRVAPLRARFSAAALAACDLLVISNAQPNDQPWTQYPDPTPSAFADDEIRALHAWVEQGGALLLIADHMPLAGAAKALAAAFGAEFYDGFAFPRAPDGAPIDAGRGVPTLFLRAGTAPPATTAGGDTIPERNGALTDHPISNGRDASERITMVRSFTGQAFRVTAPGARPVMSLPSDFVSLEPRYAWQFAPGTRVRDVGGWLQGATLTVGRGRLALFGEAAMFSAQRAGPTRQPMGMNAPMAEQNPRFVLNVLHWLAGLLGA